MRKEFTIDRVGGCWILDGTYTRWAWLVNVIDTQSGDGTVINYRGCTIYVEENDFERCFGVYNPNGTRLDDFPTLKKAVNKIDRYL